MYVNDMLKLISCCCRLYADNLLHYKIIRSDEDYVSLQSDLVALQEWADDWQMKSNALKCQHIFFAINRHKSTNYMICNEVIKQVNSIKYL